MAQTAELLFNVYSRTDNPLLRATLPPVVADPSGFAQAFYAHLFKRAPGLRTLFAVVPDVTMLEAALLTRLPH